MARFHVRGGAKWRKVHTKIYKAKNAKYACPACSKHSVERIGVGLWKCKSCSASFAGGAYELSTPVGRLSQRLISDLNKKGKISAEEIKALEEAMNQGAVSEEDAEPEKTE
jgi:large subunit ribosomal protein L37Ae